MVKKCTIDIGSNTIKLYIADLIDNNTVKPLELKRRMALLGKVINITNKLSDKAKEITIKHIKDYLEICKSYNITSKNILFTATAACRNASDGKDFINQLKTQFNIEYIKILSPHEEGKYTFLGSLESVKTDTETMYYVIDVGGGSFQISRGYKNNFLEGLSIQIGCNRLTEEFDLNQQVPPDKIDTAISYIKNLDILKQYKHTLNSKLIGAGGTIKIIQLMLKGINDFTPITFNELSSTVGFIGALNPEGRFKWFKSKYQDDEFRKDAGLTIERAEVFLAGICIVIGILENLSIQEITPCKTDAKDYLIKLTDYETLFNSEAQE